MNDLRYAVRMLWKNPGFTAVAVLTLALGIGANTAMFSFVNAILLRPLPFKEPDRLVMVFENLPSDGLVQQRIGAPVLGEWRRQTTSFEGLAARRGRASFSLTGKGQAENIPGSLVSANMFFLLGLHPFLGRDFLPEEEIYGHHHVVMLGYEIWRRRFGGETNIIGQSITLNAELFTVIGVMPPRTCFPERISQLWAPLAFSPEQLANRHGHDYLVYGRLKPGVTLAQARVEMNLVAGRMAGADEKNKGWGAEVHPLQEIMVGDSRKVLLVLLGSVGLVLLIGCVNIANLLMARSAARAREFAIRAALGAGRGQILRQLLTESLLLAVLGGAAGIVLASLGLGALVRLSPPDLPRIWEGIDLDGRTLAFTLLVTFATGIIFGLIPAWQFSHPAPAQDLSDNTRGSSAGRNRQRIRGALVVSEVALSMMLLIGAGLMIRSFSQLLSQQLGYQPENLITMGILLPDKKYPDQAARARVFDPLLAQARALPGLQSAALGSSVPLGHSYTTLSMDIVGAPPSAPGDASTSGYLQVSPGYFNTMNIPLIQGRDFTAQDRTNTRPVVIVDQTFAKLFKLGANILGRRINLGDGTEGAVVVGVVGDLKIMDLAEAPRGEIYVPYQQMCWGFMRLIIRTQREPAEMTQAIRAELDRIDKDQPSEDVRTMTQMVASSVAQRRLSVQLLGGFAGVAMLLAAIGLYGVLAYNVTQRTREIGIRMALGAKRNDVLGLVLKQGMTLSLVGIGIGLAGAVAMTRVLRGLLFGVNPTDPVTFAAITLLLSSVAFLACWLPARRATKVDPMIALRNE